jgi:hypothetical protein
LRMVKQRPILSVVTSLPLPWYHPRNVHADHQKALELMVEIIEAAVDDALPEARRRHPLPGIIPGALLGPLVRDGARKIALSSAYEGHTLRAAHAPSLGLHLLTRDDLLRIRVRKMPDPELPVPDPNQLELDLGPMEVADEGLFGELPELALFWAVQGEALYRAVLALPAGWDDVTQLSTWYGAVELSAPAVRTLAWPIPGIADGSERADVEADDLDDVVERRVRHEDDKEAPGDAS